MCALHRNELVSDMSGYISHTVKSSILGGHITFIGQLVQMLQQFEVCWEEDICSALGHQVSGMVCCLTADLHSVAGLWKLL